jgi:hypothetical protein
MIADERVKGEPARNRLGSAEGSFEHAMWKPEQATKSRVLRTIDNVPYLVPPYRCSLVERSLYSNPTRVGTIADLSTTRAAWDKEPAGCDAFE